MGAVKEVMVGEGAAETRAAVWEEAWLGAVTDVELVAGRRAGDGTETGLVAGALVGLVVGSGASTELGAGAEAGF